jgi:hypothetical protein
MRAKSLFDGEGSCYEDNMLKSFHMNSLQKCASRVALLCHPVSEVERYQSSTPLCLKSSSSCLSSAGLVPLSPLTTWAAHTKYS